MELNPVKILVRSLAVAAVGALVLTGCGDDKKKSDDNASGTPKRIVSLSPSSTEMLFAIGAGKQVVAVDNNSDFPAEAPKTDLSGFKPNVEAITKLNPDMVVLSNDKDGLVKQLETLKIKVVQAPAAKTFDDTYKQLADLGTATGHVNEATAVVTKMKTDIADIVSQTKSKLAQKPAKELTYFHELGDEGYSATSKTFIGEVYSLFGLKNVADAADKDGASGGYPQMSQEAIVTANPDLVFLADSKCCGQSAETVAKRPGWDKTTAVQKNQVFAMDDSLASRWGPRVVDYVRAVSTSVEKAAA